MALPSATQLAWLWDDYKPSTVCRKKALPPCYMDLQETFARYGQPKQDDRLRWQKRAKARDAKVMAECSEGEGE